MLPISLIEEKAIYLANLPMPPTVNQIYAGKVRRYKSAKYKEFDVKMQSWQIIHQRKLEHIYANVQAWHNTDLQIRVDRYFLFTTKSLYTAKGNVKEMDVSNRVKAFDDALAKLIGIDDRYFWLGLEEKIEIENGQQECVITKISPYQTRTLEQLKVELGLLGKNRGFCL